MAGAAVLHSDNTVSLAGAPAPIPLVNLVARSICVDDFYASADGADWGPAFNRCIGNAYTGQKMTATNRSYLLNTAVTISQRGLSFHGCGRNYGSGPNNMTTLCTSNSTPGFVPLTITGQALGTELHDFGVYETHPVPATTPNTAWSPTPYWHFIQFLDLYNGFKVDGLEFYGVNKGIYVRSCGHFEVGSIHGDFYSNALQVENCRDKSYFDIIRAWDYQGLNMNQLIWKQANLRMLKFGRVDGYTINDLFAIGALSVFYGYQEAPNSALNTPGGAPQGLITELSGDHCMEGFFLDGLQGNGMQLVHRIGHIDCSTLDINDVQTGNAVPLVGGATMRFDNCNTVQCNVVDFLSGYSAAEALNISGSDVNVQIGSYTHNTPNFYNATPAPAMMQVSASQTWPNRIVCQSGRVINRRNAPLFGGAGASRNTYMGPCSFDNQNLIIPGITP